MTDYRAEEGETDRLVDEWHERQPGMTAKEITQAEVMATIRRVAAELEQMEHEALGQHE